MLRPTMLRYVVLACCDRSAGALGVEHCGQRSKLALIKRTFDPVFSVSRLIWNQLRQIFQTNHSNSYQCRIQWASSMHAEKYTD